MGNRRLFIAGVALVLLLPAGGLDVVRANGVDIGMLSGTLKTKSDKQVPEIHNSSLKCVARFFEPNAVTLNHDTDSVTFSFSDDTSGLTSVGAFAPGSSDWKGRKGKFSFRSTGFSAKVDQTTGLVTMKAKSLNLYNAYYQSPLSVHFTVNTDTITIRDVWTPVPGKPGCFVYEP